MYFNDSSPPPLLKAAPFNPALFVLTRTQHNKQIFSGSKILSCQGHYLGVTLGVRVREGEGYGERKEERERKREKRKMKIRERECE